MKTLINTARIKLTAAQSARLIRIDEENLDAVALLAEKDLMEKGRVPMNAEKAMYGLRQYYALAALNPKNMHAVSLAVDPYWHAHVLHTAQYARFCNEAVGYFMHHIPLNQSDPEMVQAVYKVYGYSLDVLRHIFGEENVDPTCWSPDATKAEMICFHGNDCGHANPESILDASPEFANVRETYGTLLAA